MTATVTHPRPTCGRCPMVAVSWDRRDLGLGVAVAVVALVVYVLTLAPGLLRADSGELQTLAVTLGYAHPTGYPVYLLLA